MSAWTLEQARQHLQAWLDADIALATGKEYKIGGKSLTRSEVTERLQFWKREVNRLSGRTNRFRRVIPYD